jgi:aryl-alcohol dehydrogenase-like predicted oxidoreductase
MFGVATSYGSGHSESSVSDAIKGRLDRFILSAKAGMPSGPGPLQVGLSRQNLTESIEKSLKRMLTDCIDVFQLHSFDALTPIEETLPRSGISLARAKFAMSAYRTSPVGSS